MTAWSMTIWRHGRRPALHGPPVKRVRVLIGEHSMSFSVGQVVTDFAVSRVAHGALDSDPAGRYVRAVEAAVVAAWNGRSRRVATGTVALALIATAAGVVLLTRSHNDSGVALSTRPTQVSPAKAHGHLIYGMTAHQVLRRTGQPTKTQGSCWLFSPTKTGTVGSISVQPSWSRLPYNPRTTRDLKLCFTGGAFSHGYLRGFDMHTQKWVWFPWPLTLVHGAANSFSRGF